MLVKVWPPGVFSPLLPAGVIVQKKKKDLHLHVTISLTLRYHISAIPYIPFTSFFSLKHFPLMSIRIERYEHKREHKATGCFQC